MRDETCFECGQRRSEHARPERPPFARWLCPDGREGVFRRAYLLTHEEAVAAGLVRA